jgi:hypothetical protein
LQIEAKPKENTLDVRSLMVNPFPMAKVWEFLMISSGWDGSSLTHNTAVEVCEIHEQCASSNATRME